MIEGSAMLLNRREGTLAYTAENPFDRFPDGRPHVPDDLLRRMRLVTSEEARGVLRRSSPVPYGPDECRTEGAIPSSG
jgi:hypothetical protein